MPDTHTIAENLTRLQTARTDIASAITTKGGTVATGAGFEDFPTAIGTIPSGGSATLITKSITENGTYNASSDSADGYSSVTVAVPNTYSAGDEGKVVSNGALVAQTARPDTITTNGNYITTNYNSVTVNVPSGGGSQDLIDLIERDITSISIPSGTTKVGQHAFDNCRALTSVTMPNTVTRIEAYAFQYCDELAEVNFSTSLTYIGDSAFTGGSSGANKITSITLPSSVTGIGASAFRYCTYLTYLDLSATTMTQTAVSMAANCTGLQTVKLPATLTYINQATFGNCTALTAIVIPANVATISPQSLYNCTSLTSIKFEGSTPPAASNSNWFSGVPTSCVIQVPTGSLTAYTTANNYPDPNTYTYVEY